MKKSYLTQRVHAYEAKLIEEALTETRGHVRDTAKILGLAERTMWNKLNKFEIDPVNFRIKSMEGLGVDRLRRFIDTIESALDVTGHETSKRLDRTELAERLYLGGFKRDAPDTMIAITRALHSGAMDHI